MSEYVLKLATAHGLPCRTSGGIYSWSVKIGGRRFGAAECRRHHDEVERGIIQEILTEPPRPVARSEIIWDVGAEIKLSAFSNDYVRAYEQGEGILVAFREGEKVRAQIYSQTMWLELEKGLAHRARPERTLFLKKYLPNPIAYEIAQNWL
jgi:hypothetical protein